MKDLLPHDTLLLVWLAFTIAASLAVIAVLVWAVRSKQFSNQKRARYLPLKSGIPEDPAAPARGKH